MLYIGTIYIYMPDNPRMHALFKKLQRIVNSCLGIYSISVEGAMNEYTCIRIKTLGNISNYFR
jgi:hypothetical protein